MLNRPWKLALTLLVIVIIVIGLFSLTGGFDCFHLPGTAVDGYASATAQTWEDTVAAYVYPSVVQVRVDRFKNDDRYRELLYYSDYTQTKCWAFVNGLVKGTIVV